MSGILTVSYSETRFIQKVVFDWNSDAGGLCDGVTKKLSGKIARVTFVPSSVAAPTEGYTVKIQDEDGVDILMGYGAAGLSATLVRTVVPRINDAVQGQPSYPVVFDGNLTISVVGAGDTKSGIVSLYIER